MALAVVPATATADPFEIRSFTATPSTTQAGAHPDLYIKIEFCDPPHTGPTRTVCRPIPIGDQERLKDWLVQTPPGFLGNPVPVPVCEYATYITLQSDGFTDSCPADSQIAYTTGYADTEFGVTRTTPGNIYNVRPVASEAARWGAIIHPDPNPTGTGFAGEPAVWQPTTFNLRTDGDFGLDSFSPNFFKQLFIAGTFAAVKVRIIEVFVDGTVNGTPFLTNPTNCESGPDQVVGTEAASWEHPNDRVKTSVPFVATGCDNVPFDPSIDIAPTDTTQAGAATGFKIGVNFPNSENDPIHQAHLRDSKVTLPPGVALNASAANELAGCTEAQFGLGNNDAVECPAASQVGDVKVETPVQDGDPTDPDLDPLSGKVYFAEPTGSDPWRIFLNVTGAGLNIKLEGKIEIDEQTGRITTRFDESPQTPFTRFELTMRGGAHAILKNPDTCGTNTIEADFKPWSGQPSEHHTGSYQTTGCSSPTPFQPTVGGFTNPKDAGGLTTSRLIIDRPEGHQLIKRLHVALPSGLLGSLTAVPLCPRAAGVAGTCSAASKIGSVVVDAGAGSDPVRVTGEAFLTEPLPGDAAGLAIKVPAKTGPVDLGVVNVMNRIVLRQSDGGLDVISGDLPEILKGVPLTVRKIDVNVDRPGLFRNPTSCALKTLVAAFVGNGGGTASASFSDAAINCHRLPFAPRLSLSVGPVGETGKGKHPFLRAIVTQGAGEAAISRAEVLLPQVLRPDVKVLNTPGKLCLPDQIAANTCPPASNIGTAAVYTPILPQPLSGPVYIVQDPTGASGFLPRLVVRLGGLVSIDLNAQNKLQGVRTLNIFENVPDVPQSRFDLAIKGGSDGILFNFEDLCDEPDHGDAKFFAHSGAIYAEQTPLRVEGCKATASSVSISKRTVRMSRKGRVKIRVRCRGDETCKGSLKLDARVRVSSSKRKRRTLAKRKFSVPAGKTRTVELRVKKRYRRQILRKRKTKVRATLKLNGARAKHLTVRLKGRRR